MRRALFWLVALAFLAGCPSKQPKPKPSPVPVASAEAATKVDVAHAVTRSIARDLSMPGTIAANNSVNVSSQVSGAVRELYVEMGDFVSKGEVLARLDSSLLEAQIKTARAQLAGTRAESFLYWPDGSPRDPADVPGVRKAKAVMDNAHQKYEEYRELRKQELISDQNLADIRQQYVGAKADYETALEKLNQARAAIVVSQAQLDQLLSQTSDYVIRAPMDAVVQQRGLNVGDVVSAGQPTNLVLVSYTPLLVMVDVPQRYAAQLAVGQSIRFTCDAYPGRNLQARVRRLAPVAKVDTRAIPVEGIIDSPPRWLRPGMAVKVWLTTEAPEVHVMVPDAAVLTQDGKSSVFVLQPSGQDYVIKQRSVTTGESLSNWVEVQGVKEDELVAASAIDGLHDGDHVEVDQTLKAPSL